MKQISINNIWGEQLMQTKYLFYFLLVSAFMLAIAGCGGGGGGGSAAGATISSIPDNPPSSPSTPSQTGNVTLAWDAPTTNEDGSDLTDLAGYRVYYGTSSGSYTNSVNIGNFTSAVISNLSLGTWYFAITAYNSSSVESSYSTELSTTI